MAVTVQRIATLRYAQGQFEAARTLFEGDPPLVPLIIYTLWCAGHRDTTLSSPVLHPSFPCP